MEEKPHRRGSGKQRIESVTSTQEPLPQFLGLGAQKSGTTTLHEWLASHPQVFVPAAKELHFFSLHYQRGVAWYSEQFAAAKSGQLCGEITPYYLFHPLAPQRISTLLPNARCIVLLRDPVERCLSHYFHSCRLGFENLSLHDAIEAESQRLDGALDRLSHGHGRDQAHQEQSYLSRSRYEEQLQRYELSLRQGRLLVLRSEDLFEDADSCWRQIQVFLGLDYQGLPFALQGAAANVGAGEAQYVDDSLRLQLRKRLVNTYAVMEESYGLRWPQ